MRRFIFGGYNNGELSPLFPLYLRRQRHRAILDRIQKVPNVSVEALVESMIPRNVNSRRAEARTTFQQLIYELFAHQLLTQSPELLRLICAHCMLAQRLLPDCRADEKGAIVD